MTAAKPITVISLALMLPLAGISSALAAPAGSEYLPDVPTAPHHHSGGSTSASSDYSDTTSGSTTTTATSTDSRDQKPKHAKEERAKPKAVPHLKLSSAEADSGSGRALLPPLALLLAAGLIIAASGSVLRRHQTRRLAYQAEKRRQIGPHPPRISDSGGKAD